MRETTKRWQRILRSLFHKVSEMIILSEILLFIIKIGLNFLLERLVIRDFQFNWVAFSIVPVFIKNTLSFDISTMVFLIAPQHFNLLRCTLIRDVYEFLLRECIKIVFFNFQISLWLILAYNDQKERFQNCQTI